MTRNKLISFCYFFIVGIGIAMLYPAQAEALPILWGLTALFGLAAIAAFGFQWFRRRELRRR